MLAELLAIMLPAVAIVAIGWGLSRRYEDPPRLARMESGRSQFSEAREQRRAKKRAS